MKSFRQLCAALVLTVALFGSAFAGDILTPGITTTGDVGFPPAASAPGDVGFPPASATGTVPGPGVASFGDILTPGIAILMSAIVGG